MNLVGGATFYENVYVYNASWPKIRQNDLARKIGDIYCLWVSSLVPGGFLCSFRVV